VGLISSHIYKEKENNFKKKIKKNNKKVKSQENNLDLRFAIIEIIHLYI